MKIKKLSKSSLIFREIIENNTKKNLKLSVLATRALIRYSVRIFSLNFSKILLKQYLILYKIIFFKKKIYEKYILQINIFRIDCRILFADKKLDEYVKKRIEWANFILSNSLSKEEKNAALQYLRILNIFGYYKKKILANSVKTSKVKKNKKKLYIYGPNSAFPPNPKYFKYIIVLTKMIDFDISNFKDSILILNYFTSNQLTEQNEKLLLKKYNKIYLSTSKKKIKYPFKKFYKEKDIAGHIASSMALGRILNRLSNLYPNAEFIIEGFDFYLSKNAYNKYITTGYPLKFNQLTEYLICQSIFDHEPLFNFLYVKNIISKLKIKDSHKFIEIMKLSGYQYLKRLSKIRSCYSLSYNSI